MMVGPDETTEGCGGNGTGLLGSAINASTQAALRSNMAWKRSYPAAIEQNKCLLISRTAIESSERPMAVVGQRPSGKSQHKGHNLVESSDNR